MRASINIQGFPSPFMFVGIAGPITVQLGDEAGKVLTDEAGQILSPDLPPGPINLEDEQNNILTDENGRILTPDGS